MDFNQNDNNILITEIVIKCKKTEEYIENTWKKIILCDFKEGMENIAILFGELQTIITYFDSLNKTQNCQINIQNIFEKLDLLEKAISIPDYVLVADVIKYEIKPIIEEWRLKVTN